MPTSSLATEVIDAILLQLPALDFSRENVRTLCKFGEASSRFLAISRSPHIWKSHYAVQWARCDPEHEETRKGATQENWWKMYVARSELDDMALVLLNDIVQRRGERNVIASQLASHGYDIWEILSGATKVEMLQVFDNNEGGNELLPAEGYTVRYWALEVLGVISRIRAIHTWKKLVYTPNDEFSFERGIAAFSAFFGADLDQISADLDKLASDCRDYLFSKDFLPHSSQHELVVPICAWMKQQRFEKADFGKVSHNFPHFVLQDQRKTQPLPLVYVFVCVARRLGVNAFPVALPDKTIAVVLPVAGHPSRPFYVDVSEATGNPTSPCFGDLSDVINILRYDPARLPRATPASATAMVARVASTIMQSLRRPSVSFREDNFNAHYAACCAALFVTKGDPRFVRPLFTSGVGGPLDRIVVLKETLATSLPRRLRPLFRTHLAGGPIEDIRNFTPRNAPRDNVKYFVGMFFLQIEENYTGVIVGWNYRCEAREEWGQRMGVDDLIRKSNQPFYQGLTLSGDLKYMPEDIIEPVYCPAPSDIKRLLANSSVLGRWLDGVYYNPPNPVRFIMSQESRLAYPMDDEVGIAFSAQPLPGDSSSDDESTLEPAELDQ